MILKKEKCFYFAKIPHSPIRSEGSIGLVIERKRSKNDKDGLMWFSETANELLYEEYFKLTNIEKDFLQYLKDFTLMKN